MLQDLLMPHINIILVTVCMLPLYAIGVFLFIIAPCMGLSIAFPTIFDRKILKDKSSPLTEEFFLEKLKEDGLEVTSDEVKRYRVFLKRYIHYKIRNRHHDVSSRARMHFDKRDANEFTPEELLESAILFERDSAFLKQEYTHHVN